jgi:hypothetical protein
VVEQSSTICDIEKNRPECIILGTGYAKGKQIEAVKIECSFPVCNGGVEMKPTNKKTLINGGHSTVV